MKFKLQTLFQKILKKFQNPRNQPEKNQKFKINNDILVSCQPALYEKEIIIPKNIRIIGSAAFYNCRNAERIILPDGVTHIRISAFANCRSLKYIRLPDSIVSIGEAAFSGCDTLEEIQLPPELKVISKQLFKDCPCLKTIRLPKHIRQLEESAFSGCLSLEEIHLDSGGDIPDFLFLNCRNLKTVTIPSASGRIGRAAFQNCQNLRNIVLPSRIRTIDANAFQNCLHLTGIQIPENVEFIGYEAFKNTGLEYVVLPSTIAQMGSDVFADSKLERVCFTEGIKEIYPCMFRNCVNLKEIQIPEGVRYIQQNAFSGCVNLTEITIPESVISVSYTAFTLCHSLRDVNWHGLHFSVKALCNGEIYSAPYEAMTSIITAVSPESRKETKNLHDSKITAVYQYLFQKYLQNPEEEKLSEYIQENTDFMFRALIAVRDTALMQKLLSETALFTKEMIQNFILFANQEQAYEIQIMLSEYQHQAFAQESIEEIIKNKFEL